MKVQRTAVLATGIAIVLSVGARASTLLTGPTSNAGSYSTATLAGIAAPGDTVNSGGLTGISLWGLLGGANSATPTSPIYGGITTSTPAGDNAKNSILRYYLLATGSGGAKSVISLGEIDPNFGGTSPVAPFVAFKNTGGSLLGAPELIVPGAPARDVSNLTSLQLLSVPAIGGSGGLSKSMTLSGAVSNPGVYTLSNLQSDFTPVHQVVSGDTYTGVPLWTFIDPSTAAITDMIVVAKATDGYEVLYSLAELDPSLGGNPSDLLPYADTGTDLLSSAIARTILPSDNKHGRWESNLVSVDVAAATPLPPTWTMMLIGLAGFGFAAFRRTKNDATRVAAA
jgi:hypothetical protein